MKRKLFLVLALLLVVTGVDAQKVDQRLMRLVQHAATTRALSAHPDGSQAASNHLVARYNADGTIKNLSAYAILEKGAECPTALLEQMGIQVRFIIDDMVGLVIPADKLADLILCGIGEELSNNNIIDCMKKIFEYADQVGKPAVISVSLGNPLGLHDGSEMVGTAIAKLTDNGTKPGRAVVVSSGNQREHYQSIVQKLSGADDELKSVLGARSFTSDKLPRYRQGFIFYADDYKDFSIEIKLVNIATGAVEEWEKQMTDSDGDVYRPKIEKNTDVPTAKGGKAVTYGFDVERRGTLDDPNLRLALFVKPGSAGQTIKMVCDGDNNDEPCFDAPTEGGYDFKTAGYTKGNGNLACNTSICNMACIFISPPCGYRIMAE